MRGLADRSHGSEGQSWCTECLVPINLRATFWRGTGHIPREPLSTIRRTPQSRGNGGSIIIMAGN